MFKNGKTKLISIILALVMLSSVGAAIIGAESESALAPPDHIKVRILSQTFMKTEEEIIDLYYELGSLEAVEKSFSPSLDYGLLTQDEILYLYEIGVSVTDMEKADELSYYSQLTSMEIINLKLSLSEHYEDNEKAWEKVLKELGMDKYYKFDKTAFTDEQIDILLINSYNIKDIFEMDNLVKKYDMTFERIFSDYQNGYTYDDLKDIYKAEYELTDKYKDKKQKEDEFEKSVIDSIVEKVKKIEGDN